MCVCECVPLPLAVRVPPPSMQRVRCGLLMMTLPVVILPMMTLVNAWLLKSVVVSLSPEDTLTLRFNDVRFAPG